MNQGFLDELRELAWRWNLTARTPTYCTPSCIKEFWCRECGTMTCVEHDCDCAEITFTEGREE